MIAYTSAGLNWRMFLGQLKVRVRRSVTEPRAVATGLLSCSEFFNNQKAGRYRSRFCNDRFALAPADSHL